jgi:hypothetical protein
MIMDKFGIVMATFYTFCDKHTITDNHNHGECVRCVTLLSTAKIM